MSGPTYPDRTELFESDGSDRCRPGEPSRSAESTLNEPSDSVEGKPSSRILFLDDDPRRAEIFLIGNPEAVWIQTAEECIAKLAESWDEVYLDHDLGGEHYVDVDRHDCGMEVVRWLCKEPRSHLIATQFIIHSHNLAAAMMMVLLMRETGYNAEFLPFGFNLEMEALATASSMNRDDDDSARSIWSRLIGRLRSLGGFFRGRKRLF